MELRVAVMNLQSGVGTTKGFWHYVTTGWKYFLPHSHAPLIQAGLLLHDEHIDIALCTEVTDDGVRSHYRAQSTLVRDVAALPHSHFFPAMYGRLALEGSALLSRFPITEHWTHPLHGPRSQRVLGDSLISVPGGAVRVFVAHLSLNPVLRAVQIEEVADRAGAAKEPCILGGDFNEGDVQKFAPLLDKGFTEYSLPTYPSWHPERSYIRLFLRDLRATRLENVPTPAISDHLPLIASIERD